MQGKLKIERYVLPSISLFSSLSLSVLVYANQLLL